MTRGLSERGALRKVLKGRIARDECFPAQVPGLKEKYVTLSGGERARVVLGGEDGADSVVFVHGWGCSAYFFRHIYAPVIESGRRVIAVELRGHGWSDRPLDPGLYSAEAMMRYLAEVLDELDVGPAHFISHSLGGGVTLDLLAVSRDRGKSLTLLAPVGLGPLKWIGMMRLMTPRIVAPLIPYGVPRWSIPLVLKAVYGSRGRWASHDVDEYWAATADPDYARALRLLLHQYSFAPRSDESLARIDIPMLVVLGARDLLVNTPRARTRAQLLGARRVVVVPRAGHVLAEEVPKVVIQELLAHIVDAS